MYRFTVGTRVKYFDDHTIQGTVVKRVSFDEEEGVRLDVEDPTTPWYDVLWDGNRDGFEHDESLIPM